MFKAKKVADLHVHMPEQKDASATFKELQRLADYGIKDINIASITYMEYTVEDNIKALYCKEMFKDAKVSVFGGLYYSPIKNYYGESFLEQAQRLLDMGCDGIKLLENKPQYRKYIGFGLDSKLYDEMFDMLEEKQIPILCHSNDPSSFWNREEIASWPDGQWIIGNDWLYDKPEYLTYEETRAEMMRRLEKNPNLNIVFAHFMFLGGDLNFATEMFETYPNVKLDLTPGREMFIKFRDNYDGWKAFFEKYSERIFYGTDTGFYEDPIKVHESVRYAIGGSSDVINIPYVPHYQMQGFDLSQEAQDNICYNNYMKFIGTPKKVNLPLVIEEGESILKALKNNDGDAGAIQRLEDMLADMKEMTCK